MPRIPPHFAIRNSTFVISLLCPAPYHPFPQRHSSKTLTKAPTVKHPHNNQNISRVKASSAFSRRHFAFPRPHGLITAFGRNPGLWARTYLLRQVYAAQQVSEARVVPQGLESRRMPDPGQVLVAGGLECSFEPSECLILLAQDGIDLGYKPNIPRRGIGLQFSRYLPRLILPAGLPDSYSFRCDS